MPKTVKSVAKHYTYNTTYTLDARRFESIINVLEASRENLNKPQVAHIVLQVDSIDFEKSLINETLTKALEKELETGYGYYIAMENSEYSGYHIHIMLTFSTGNKYAFTVLNKAVQSLYDLEQVNTAIALPRKTDRSVSIDTKNYYTAFKTIKEENNYFHILSDDAQFNDAVHRYSYLAKDETKDIKGKRLTQSKKPKAYKTKQSQAKRINTIKNKDQKDNKNDE